MLVLVAQIRPHTGASAPPGSIVGGTGCGEHPSRGDRRRGRRSIAARPPFAASPTSRPWRVEGTPREDLRRCRSEDRRLPATQRSTCAQCTAVGRMPRPGPRGVTQRPTSFAADDIGVRSPVAGRLHFPTPRVSRLASQGACAVAPQGPLAPWPESIDRPTPHRSGREGGSDPCRETRSA